MINHITTVLYFIENMLTYHCINTVDLMLCHVMSTMACIHQVYIHPMTYPVIGGSAIYPSNISSLKLGIAMQ